jgi:hypothetical protein
MDPLDLHTLLSGLFDGPLAALGAAWTAAALFCLVRLMTWR